MDDGSPTLEVGFAIDTGGSFDELIQLQNVMSSTEAKVIAEAVKIEKATGGMVNLAGAKASISSFGNAVTKEAQIAARELSRVEKAGEALSRQMGRDAAAFGKTRSELRLMKVEAAAVAAEQQGLAELAQRLRAQEADLYAQEFAAARQASMAAEAAAEDKAIAAQRAVAAADQEAKALREAAFAHQMFEMHVRQGVAAMREQAAQQAAAAAAADDLATRARRLVNSIDPAAAAQDRFNREMAEARTLISAGAITLDDYAAKLRMEQAALNANAASLGRGAKSANAHQMAMQGATYQVQDFLTQVSMGQNPLNAFAVNGAQLAGQFSNIEGKAGNVARFFMGPWGLAITGALMIASMFTKDLFEMGDGADKAKKGTLDLSSAIDFQKMSIRELIDAIDELERAQSKQLMTARQTEIQALKNAEAALKEATANRQKAIATLQALKADQSLALNRMGGEDLVGVIPAGFQQIRAAKGAAQRDIDDLQKAIGTAEQMVRGTKIPIMARQVAETTDAAAGATGRFERAIEALDGRFRAGTVREKDYIAQRAKLTNEHEAALKAARDAGKVDKAEQNRLARLGREADATEAQIRNLYALAAAYGVSSAAALIAEAQVTAESKAIKQRSDIEAAVDRQVQLAIAQRVSDAAKATAGMREQADAQAKVNAMVAAGLVPASEAADLVKDQIADLPLLAALQAAQQRGLATEAERATKALADERAERERLAAAERHGQFLSAREAGTDRLAELREELRLVGATDAARAAALATLKATQEARKFNPEDQAAYIAQQVEIARTTEELAAAQREWNDALNFTADKWDLIARNVQQAGQGMADAFGKVGSAIGDMASIYAAYRAQEEHAKTVRDANLRLATSEAAKQREMAKYNLATSTAQVGLYGDMASAAKGFFKEGSDGYRALQKAEQTFRAIQFALSVRAMAQDAIETAQALAKSGVRAAKYAVEAVAKAIASLPFPLNLVAGAATAAALVSLGIAVGGSFGGSKAAPTNTGTGTVLGDSDAKSESIKRSIDALKEVDTVMLGYSRQMAASLRSIESQIGGFASVLVRQGDSINANANVTTGFKPNLIGSILGAVPLIGGFLKGLFGSRYDVIGSGISGGPQQLGGILNGGFNAQYYSDVQKTKKFLGIVTGRSTFTEYAAADPALKNQFTLILREFNDAIAAAAGPLGEATSSVQTRLNSFVVNLGKIELKGLTGEQIQEKLNAVFGAAADNMATAAFPFIQQFQKVGEGAFETLVRVASTLEAVGASLDMLGQSAQGMGIAAKLGLADQFDSVSALTSAADAYFQSFYTREEQAAARTAQMGKVFASLGMAMPSTLAGFRQLVEAQNQTTTAGQATYATLLKLAPAFADLMAAMDGAKSAADIAAERQDLERKLLELRGDTAALRALELAKLDQSNRALQQQVWAIQDAQAAAKAADELRQAWTSVGDAIMTEVNRIRGISNAGGSNNFAALLGQFNAATASARAGDMDAAKSLPGLSQAMLSAAALVATSRQELDRVQAQTAASLEATNALIRAANAASQQASDAALLEAGAQTQTSTAASNDNLMGQMQQVMKDMLAEMMGMRSDNNAGHAATAGNTGKMARTLDNVTSASGGDALATVKVA